ncbi:MAG: PTS fructose transporter subunit IIA [Lachnospiraceae bacterium]
MVGLLVTGHGHFATGLGSSLQLIAGEQPNVALVDFEADHSIEILKDNLMKAFDSLKECDGVLVLSDLPGGSPFKTAVECKFERPDQAIEVISGTNLPLLIASSTMMAAFESPLELAEAMIPEGKDSIVRFELAARVEEAEEDGI